ncbi:MAG: GW dipeptide domain-containing protein [Saonia sp.]
MILKFKYIPLIIITLTIVTACNNTPKVIEPATKTERSPDSSTPLTTNADTSSNTKLHTVVINEILPTERYVYLKVKEGKAEFWIATGKMEVKKGETYFYKGGLLKTDFKSEEYDRVFKEIYLVMNLVSDKDHSKAMKVTAKDNSVGDKRVAIKEDIPTHTEKIIGYKGAISIAELVKDPKKYEGHSVQISGTCVKVNPDIMNRNWMHIRDGSKDDYDLVVTSNAKVPEGSDITIRAIVALNRDFGAGYTYDLILENGTLVQ